MKRRIAVTVMMLAATTGLLVGGPLSPAPGPVASTFKTLGEVEPRVAINTINTPGDADSLYKITQPGSYYLTGNLIGVSGKTGIEVASSNVTIDLCGFNVVGVNGTLSGINASQMSRVIVKNGTISAWGSRGVIIGAGGAVEGVTVDHCLSNGIEVTTDCSVTRCTSIANLSYGIFALRGSSLTGCTVSSNGHSGVVSVGAILVSGCSAIENTDAGLTVDDGSTVRDCTAQLNGLDGITAGDDCIITGNQCINNGDDGIECGGYCQVFRNRASGNDAAGDGGGVYTVGVGSRIEDNLFVANRYGVNVAAGSDNIIIRNTCRNNVVNFQAFGTQELAPVITNPGANGFATMTPWSNVAY